MTLQDLEWQGLLTLPTTKEWKTENTQPKDESELVLLRVEMWGYQEGNDDGVRLYCLDGSGETRVAEIAHFSECLSRYFISTFFVENYGQKISDIFSKDMKLERNLVSIFAREFVDPRLIDRRLRTYASVS